MHDVDRSSTTGRFVSDEEAAAHPESTEHQHVRGANDPRLFHLQRDTDVTGVSGTGTVAHGVRWPDGTVVIRWCVGEHRSTVMWDSIEAVEVIHGHNGATRLVWD